MVLFNSHRPYSPPTSHLATLGATTSPPTPLDPLDSRLLTIDSSGSKGLIDYSGSLVPSEIKDIIFGTVEGQQQGVGWDLQPLIQQASGPAGREVFIILASLILFVAMIGAIVLTLSHEKGIKRQDLFSQAQGS